MIEVRQFRLTLAILITVLTLAIMYLPAESGDRINPLRFGEHEKSWQLTLNLSRYANSFTIHTSRSSGVWEEERAILGTTFSLQSSFDLNEHLGFRGNIACYTDSVKTEATNLWTGTRKISRYDKSGFGDASFKIKVSILENSELKTHLLVPVLGGPAGIGLVWTKDPIMVFPKFTLNGTGFNLTTGMSFVANSAMALTGRVALGKEGEKSVLGFGGGIVYRNGEYDGIKVSASLKRGESIRASLKVGLSYGEEK